MKTEDNEHVDVHELRGFMSDDLKSAFHETYAVSRGTRAKQYLFSLSLNPPQNENSGWMASPVPLSFTKKKDADMLMSSGPASTWKT